MENAAKLANAHEFIEGLPEGPLGSPISIEIYSASRATPTDFMIFIVVHNLDTSQGLSFKEAMLLLFHATRVPNHDLASMQALM